MKTDYLIIGAGPAGINAVEGIRYFDKRGKITVVTSESIGGYSKPMISYYLAGKAGKEDMFMRPREFYGKHKVQLLLNREVVSLSAPGKKAVLADASAVHFKKLLIASGGRPVVPPVEGVEKIRGGFFTFTTAADAEGLIRYAEKNKVKNAVVLGGGLIGLKCTEGLLGRGIKVSVVELADRVLSNTFDSRASSILERNLKNAGCQVYKKDTVKKAKTDSSGALEKICLKSGKIIPAKLLIAAVGVAPAIGFLKNSGVKTGRGVIVDEYLKTNADGIYAAGDAAECGDFLSGGNSVLAIWPAAARTGRIAGINMTSRRKIKYEGGFIMNSVEIAGVPTISFGLSAAAPPGSEVLEKYVPEKNEYRKIVLSENRIVGAIFVGNIERAGIFSGIIRDRLDVSGFKDKLLNDDFGLLILPEDYRKRKIKTPEISVFN